MPWMPAEVALKPAEAQQVSAVPLAAEPAGKGKESAQHSLTVLEPVLTREDGGGVKSAFAQQPEAVRNESPAAPLVAAVQEEARPAQPEARPPVASIPDETLTSPVKRPSPRTERRPPAPKQTATNTTEKRAKEARRAVRRFDDNLRDIPLSAYSGDGPRRTIFIHPTTIQDYYYYSTRR
jgi:hypothetical protein